MAKFKCEFDTNAGGHFSAERAGADPIGVDELLEVLRPAAMRLRDLYKNTLSSLGLRQTGELIDSIDIEDNDIAKLGYVSITVAPFGRRKKGSRKRKSRAGSSSAKYAKHNRRVSSTALGNSELGYLLEHGTPRISPAYHWMENTNDEYDEEIQGMIESNFDDLLKKKGLL